MTAGLDVAAGDAVIVMDADLQDPPEVVLELAARWREGYDVVYAVREERHGESASSGDRHGVLPGLPRDDRCRVPVDVGDFRLVDREALDAFRSMRETNRYVRGMFSWIGFRQVGVPYDREERFAGETKYPFPRC